MKAHIIPDFMYKELYDENHWIYKLDVANTKRWSPVPTGEYDSKILCQKCDAKIGQFEDYAANFYNLGKGIEFVNIHVRDIRVTFTHIKKIDYTRYKLFLLSILWKSSATNREIFKTVRLGPYQKLIRNMIYNEDPKEYNDFPCFMISIRNDISWTSQLIVPPTKIKHDFYTVYRFFIGGILYLYYIGMNIDLSKIPFQGAVNKSNEMKILHVRKGEGEELLKTYLGFN